MYRITSINAPIELLKWFTDRGKKDKRSVSFQVVELMEKYRAQIEKPKKKPSKVIQKPQETIVIPDYINGELWLKYMEKRKELGCKDSEFAIKLLLGKLAKFEADRMDVNQSLEEAIVGGWKTVWPPGGKNGKSKRDSDRAGAEAASEDLEFDDF